jgi:hypothetical protein
MKKIPLKIKNEDHDIMVLIEQICFRGEVKDEVLLAFHQVCPVDKITDNIMNIIKKHGRN